MPHMEEGSKAEPDNTHSIAFRGVRGCERIADGVSCQCQCIHLPVRGQDRAVGY
jgi:hypothetical protein